MNNASSTNSISIAGAPIYYIEAANGETPDLFFDEAMWTREAASLSGAFNNAASNKIGLKRATSPKFVNETKTEGLQLTKSVTGTDAPEDDEFTFEITLTVPADEDYKKIEGNENAETMPAPVGPRVLCIHSISATSKSK